MPILVSMDADAMPIDKLKIELKSRYSYIHLVSSLIPGLPAHPEVSRTLQYTGRWIDSASESELRSRTPELLAALDAMVGLAQQQLPPKLDWRQIAADHWENCKDTAFSWSSGVSYGWLAERFDCSRLRISDDMPYHARIGVGHHAGNAAIEEDFLIRDAFFMLAKCRASLVRLERFRDELKTEHVARDRYKLVSMFNQNVATYARYAVFGFYSFVECLINSIGEDFIARNPSLSSNARELLRGKKDGRYLSVERKLDLFPSLIRSDGKRPIVLSDPAQICEPYASFANHVKEIRDSAAHFAQTKAEIIVPPQVWEKRASDAAIVCLSVARGFWAACYPGRPLPLYLGQLDDARHAQLADQRVKMEMEEMS